MALIEVVGGPVSEERLPRIVRLNGFTERHVRRFEREIQAACGTGQPVIPIVIDSYGGDEYGMLAVVDTINALKENTPVATIVHGKAMSAGALVAASGTPGLRYIAPHAVLMVHDGTTGAHGLPGNVKASAIEADRITKLYYVLLARSAKKKDGYFADIVHRAGHVDVYFDAAASMKHGLVDEIGIPTLRMTIQPAVYNIVSSAKGKCAAKRKRGS